MKFNGMGLQSLVDQVIAKARAEKMTAADLEKAITVATGLSIANLETGYRDLVPAFFSWFRQRVFRRTDAVGNAVSWTTLTGRDSNKLLGYVKEGNRAGTIQLTKGAGSAAYATWGLEDSYTQEAANEAGSLLGQTGLEQLCVANLLQQFAKIEERMLLWGNRDVLLGAPAAPTGVASTGGDLANDDWWCVVVALTGDQLSLCSPDDLVTGITKQQSVTSPAGETYTLNAGISKRGADSLAVAASGTEKITWSVAAVKGAVAYAWFCGTHTTTIPADTAMYLEGITYTNQFVQTTAVGAGNQTLTASGAVAGTDYSKEATYSPGGIFYQWANSGDGYWVSMDNTALTMTNGRVDQLMTAFSSFFTNYRIGPEAMHVSPATYMAIESLAFSASNPRTMFIVSGGELVNGVILGGKITGALNPLTGDVVELVVNPNVPDSMIFFTKLSFPVPGSPSPRSVEVQTFGGVWRVNWTQTTRTSFHGAYAQGAIKVYAPFCFGAIGNIDVS